MSESAPTPRTCNRPPALDATLPWVVDGIDYGPAVTPAAELATWALDLAAKDVADWPEGRRHVASTRRHLLADLHRTAVDAADSPVSEDVLFVAGLLVRIFEADLGLSMADMVTILDRIGLPTDAVPRPRGPRPPSASVVAFPPRRTLCGHATPEESVACVCGHRFRTAA